MSKYNLEKNLNKFFGFKQFKGLQKSIIKNIIDNNDTFVLMPTGGGKSLCFQLPAIIKKGTAIVISPLIALMKNQVDLIRNMANDDSVAHVLNSSLSKSEVQNVRTDVLNEKTKLLYVAPESLAKIENINFLKQTNLSFLAIDEAHCISEWGHDFRPDYRNIRSIFEKIKSKIPIIAVTATATLKVQDDILKNLEMKNSKIFKASFNRPNLFYEVRQKDENINLEIVKYAKFNKGKSGIIYCLSRKKVEELTEILTINDIKAISYHAGLDSKTRMNNQDLFISENCDIVVATIAFGMGIDKPDVRFVIHYDIPKSIESYYQETGRAGRDGGEGHCLTFYCKEDIKKLEKFLSVKPIMEREVGLDQLDDVMSYAETSISRRQFILNYFGEDYDPYVGEGCDKDDNYLNLNNKTDATFNLKFLIEIIKKTNEKFKAVDIIKSIVGEKSALIVANKADKIDSFGKGNKFNKEYWKELITQASVNGFLEKKSDSIGVLKITKKCKILSNHNFSFMIINNVKKNKNIEVFKNKKESFDNKLFEILKRVRKKVSEKNNVPPYTIFQENSLIDMTIKYPVTLNELINIIGVGEGKAHKNAQYFLPVIKDYVNSNNIVKENNLILKTKGANSTIKLFIIQGIDRKLPLDEIAESKGISMSKFITEMEKIVSSGTKLDIKYWIDEILDDEQQDELYDYFMELEDDSINAAINEFKNLYDENDIRLFRIKFLNDVAN
tara:strand:- start:1746 stop:3926 length:2181 start_codon:yes stop_codon:yes gene_type:complete